MRRYTAAEARALREAATPGPWTFVVYTKNDAAVYVAEEDPEKHEHPHALVAGGVGGHRDAELLAASPDLAATVEALEAELAEARLCLLAEAGDPGGAVGLHEWWRYRMGGWCLTHTGEYEDAGASLWRDRQEGSADPAPLRWQHLFEWGEGGHPVPAGLSIRDAMRWVESQVLPKEAAEVPRG